MQNKCLNVYISIVLEEKEPSALVLIITGKITKLTLIKQSMIMETQQKKSVQNTLRTMKEVLKDTRFIKALNWLKKEQKYRLNNGYYSKENGKD